MTTHGTKTANAEPAESLNPAARTMATPGRRRKPGWLLIAAAALLAAGSVAAAIYSRPGDDAPLAVQPARHDFGTVQAGEIVQTTVKLLNRSGKTIEIKRVQSDCGCTVTELPRGKLSPWEKTTLSAQVDTSGMQGSLSVRVALLFVVEGEHQLRAAFVQFTGDVTATVEQ